MESLDRTHFQLLLALHQQGTISNAARSLFITQSAASQRLAQAERRLGVALAVKHGRTVSLTSAALHLVQAAAHSERILQSAEAEARWLDSGRAPTVKLAVTVHDALWWLPALIQELARDNDCSTIEVIRCAADDGPQAVSDGRADIHLSPFGTNGPPGQPLFHDELVAVISARNPLATKDFITAHDFDGCDYATYSDTPQDGFEHDTFLAPHNAVPATITRYESVTTIAAVVGAGSHMTIMPRWALPDDPQIAVRPLDPRPPPITWHLLGRAPDPATPTGQTHQRLVRHLCEVRSSTSRE